MEAILEIYYRPEERAHPVVCVDETSKQHIKETRQPLPMAFGMPSRYDYEYARNGVSNLFMIFAPLQGFRNVEVTERRTSIDFAHICRDLVDIHFRDAEKITLVCDNLNTHKPETNRCIKRLDPMKPDVLLRSWRSTIPRSMGVG